MLCVIFGFDSKVPGTGLEPAQMNPLDPKSSASTNSAIPASGASVTETSLRRKGTMQADANLFPPAVFSLPDSTPAPRHENSHPTAQGG